MEQSRFKVGDLLKQVNFKLQSRASNDHIYFTANIKIAGLAALAKGKEERVYNRTNR